MSSSLEGASRHCTAAAAVCCLASSPTRAVYSCYPFTLYPLLYSVTLSIKTYQVLSGLVCKCSLAVTCLDYVSSAFLVLSSTSATPTMSLLHCDSSHWKLMGTLLHAHHTVVIQHLLHSAFVHHEVGCNICRLSHWAQMVQGTNFACPWTPQQPLTIHLSPDPAYTCPSGVGHSPHAWQLQLLSVTLSTQSCLRQAV